MALTLNADHLGQSILRAIEAEIAKIAEEEAEAAAQRVRDRTKRCIAGIAASMQDHYSVERMGRDLVIRVKHEGRES